MRKFLINLCVGALLLGVLSGFSTVGLSVQAAEPRSEQDAKVIAEVKEMVLEKVKILEADEQRPSVGKILANLIMFVIGVVMSIGNVVAEAIVALIDWLQDIYA